MKEAILDKITGSVWDKSECDESMLDAFPTRYITVKLSDKILSTSTPPEAKIATPQVEVREVWVENDAINNPPDLYVNVCIKYQNTNTDSDEDFIYSGGCLTLLFCLLSNLKLLPNF